MHRIIALVVGCGLVLAAAGPGAAADVETISRGQEVALEEHLVPGKYVLFDFYADWCGPCRALEPRLLELAGRHTDRLALRKIDIVNWDSPVARQHRLSSIPHLALYGPDGRQIATGDARSVLQRLTNRLGDGPAGGSAAHRPSPLVPLAAVAAIIAVAAALVIGRRRPETGRPSPSDGRPAPVDTASRPGDPAIWFTMIQGSIEGPLTRKQLAELVARRLLDRSDPLRRTGDAEWVTVGEVLD